MTTNGPRIAPGTRKEVGLLGFVVSWVSGRVSGTGPPNLFLTLGRNRKLFRGWLHFAGRLMPGGRLPRRETEMIILRVAHARECAYEIAHHTHLAQRAGVDDSAPTARDEVLLHATDELLATRDLSDAAWDALGQYLDDRERLEFLFLVGHYDMLATTINTLRVETDARR